MSWGAQNRFKDAKTPSGSRGRSKNPELGCCPIQPYLGPVLVPPDRGCQMGISHGKGVVHRAATNRVKQCGAFTMCRPLESTARSAPGYEPPGNFS
jgi:hypothetical protein